MIGFHAQQAVEKLLRAVLANRNVEYPRVHDIRASTETIRRLAHALDGQAVFGFDFGTPGKPERELVAL